MNQPVRPTWIFSRWAGTLTLLTVLLATLNGWCLLGLPFPLDGDSTGFLPQILAYKNTGKLVNTIYRPALNVSPKKDGRYIWHGILFPILTGKLLPVGTYESLAWVLFFYEILVLACLAFAFSMMRPSDGSAAVGMASSLLVCAAWSSPGRPELLVSLWVALGLVVWLNTSARWQFFIAGAVIGLTACTSPIAGLLLGFLYAIYGQMSGDWKAGLLSVLAAGMIAAIVFIIPFSLYPYTLSEWISGVLGNGASTVVYRAVGPREFIQGWLLNSVSPLGLFWIGLCTCLFLLKAWKVFSGRRSWALAWFILFTSGLFFIVVRTAPDVRIYNLAALIPLFLFLSQFMLWPMTQTWSLGKRRLLAAVLLGMALLTALPLFCNCLLRFYADEGLDRSQAKVLVQEILQKNRRVDFSLGLFTLTEAPQGTALMPHDYLDRDTIDSTADIVLLQQINPYKATPPQYTNYTLVQNYFTSNSPKFCGVILAKSPRVYNFAIYKRN